MDWDAIGAIGEVIGATGVILSLLYLATQIRHSNRNYRIESARSIMSTFHGCSWDMARDAELRRITLSAATDYDGLSAEDSSAFDLLMWRYIGNATDALRLRNEGLLDEESFNVVMDSLLITIRSAPVWWERESKTQIVPPTFLEYVTKRLEEAPTKVESWGSQHENWKSYGSSSTNDT